MIHATVTIRNLPKQLFEKYTVSDEHVSTLTSRNTGSDLSIFTIFARHIKYTFHRYIQKCCHIRITET